MKRLIFWLILLLLAPALAELPPLDESERLSKADLVVLAEVVESQSKRERVHLGTNQVYTLELKVKKTEKGEFRGKALEARCWSAERRPEGWTGPGGQYQVPKLASKGRFYLRRDTRGVYHLLLPNGWDKVSFPK